MSNHSSICIGSRVLAMVAILSSYNHIMSTFAFSHPSHHHHIFGVVSPSSSPSATHYNIRLQFQKHINSKIQKHQYVSPLCMSNDDDDDGNNKFEKIDEDDDQILAFIDSSSTFSDDKGIDCYVDSYATVDGVQYTIGSPCDYAVALCYFEGDDEQLVPIELDDPLMDDIFPIAAGIIEDEFGEELVLLRTPQTLTLVGVSRMYIRISCTLYFLLEIKSLIKTQYTLVCNTYTCYMAKSLTNEWTYRNWKRARMKMMMKIAMAM